MKPKNTQRNWTGGERRKFARNMQFERTSRTIGVLGFLLANVLAPIAMVCGMGGVAYALTAAGHPHLAAAAAAPIVFTQETKEQLENSLKGLRENLGSFTEDARKEIKSVGAMSEENKAKLDKTLTEMGEARERIKAIEEKLSLSTVLDQRKPVKSVGQSVVDSENFSDFVKRGLKASGKIEVPAFFEKTAIVDSTVNTPVSLFQPPVRVPGIIEPLRRRLTIRDLLPTIPTIGNIVEFVKESSSTNAAAPQGKGSSPQVYQNVAKAESALAFALSHEAVQTLAHWIPASRQVLDDSAQLAAYINSRLTYFLKLKEEDQLLNGSGAGGDLNGLQTQATAYNTGLNVSGDTLIDKLRHAVLQLELAFADCDGFVLHPTDWQTIELTKTTGTGVTNGLYIFADPAMVAAPKIWGRPVVPTTAQTAGTFLAAQFAIASAIYDRQQNTVEISREHSDFFVKNMVAILAEERLALVTYRPEALITGSF